MTVLVVSDQSGLLLSLGSRIDATGVSPQDVDEWLDSQPPPTGAIVDEPGGLESARRVRERDRWCPIVVLVAGDELPPESDLAPLEPVRVLRRPFTASRLVEHLASMSAAQAASGRVESPAIDEPTATGPGATAVDDRNSELDTGAMSDVPAEQAPARRRGRRLRQAPPVEPSRPDVVDLDTAISTLLDSDSLPTVPDAAAAIAALLEESFNADTAVAVLVADESGWRVAAGRGLRPNDLRQTIPHDHWLARRVDTAETAVVVSGTDVARQELQGVPLISLENWLATTVSRAEAMVLLARVAEPALTIADAMRCRDVSLAGMGQLRRAMRLRQLARRLAGTQG